MKKIYRIKIFNILLFALMLSISSVFSEEPNSDYIFVKVISRPIAKKNEIIPKSTKRVRHLAIISDILPHGIWEMGPDDKGMIVTTNTVKDLSTWHTHLVTQKCIELGRNYLRSQIVGVNRQGLIDSVKSYEENFAGKYKYSFYSYNENYAVDTVIYGAGGDLKQR